MYEVQKLKNLNNLIDKFKDEFQLTYGRYPDVSDMEKKCLSQLMNRVGYEEAMEAVEQYLSCDTEDGWFKKNAHSPQVLLQKLNFVIAKIGASDKASRQSKNIKLADPFDTMIWYMKASLPIRKNLGLRSQGDTLVDAQTRKPQTTEQLKIRIRRLLHLKEDGSQDGLLSAKL